MTVILKQPIGVSSRALCQLTVCMEFRSKSEEEKDTKVVLYKWYSE